MGHQCQYEFQGCWESRRRSLYPSCPTDVMEVTPRGSLPPTPFPLSLTRCTIPPYQDPRGKNNHSRYC